MGIGAGRIGPTASDSQQNHTRLLAGTLEVLVSIVLTALVVSMTVYVVVHWDVLGLLIGG
jgi:hypothetical protein